MIARVRSNGQGNSFVCVAGHKPRDTYFSIKEATVSTHCS